ncbi:MULTISPECIES: DNA primase [Shewanella]|jgi:DNA primase|uniref:DNA primase n=2 Tax=Shewanella TaxID=22 RepID=A0A6G7LUP8_9GAMM|nr:MULTISPECIES: DNA primase [Shewanella]OIN09666.1 DNA primase [Shewanella algae]MCE9788896.1 DNA primase [Shewanella chilikensis]MCE9791637.1 DNA primase [Shewanella indica]MCE9850664.1 DNA primase [Shewanella chilikensis]MCL1156099.1 DNA primase [Shewanella chilikensis]
MAIPRDFINELIARTDIVDLIDHKVPLKKAGKNYSACCPFHSEKSPSFTVSRDKQFYHCFGCGAHGNAIDFIMEYDRLEFLDAIEELASQLGLEVPRENNPNRRRDEGLSRDLYQLMEEANRYYQSQLRQHQDKQKVLDYLAFRGLSDQVVERFGIGFAPDGWDGLLSRYRSQQESQDKLLTAGMIISNDNGKRYDRFRDRLMFPIRDRRGRVIAFGGRVLGDGTPKYLNSPETPIFHKGNELYGLYELKQAHREPRQVLIVEGYMDVVALAQFGVDYAVASLGTSTTAEQFQLLLRSAKEVVCCYDGDNAGKEAAWRALETALPLLKPGDTVRFMFLPQGEDPDSMVRKTGKEAFEALIDEAQTLTGFLFDTLTTKYGTDKGNLAKQAIALIEKIQDTVLQNLLLEDLSHRLGMNSADDLKKKLGFKSPQGVASARHKALKGRGTPLRLAVALLVQHPQLGLNLIPQPALKHLQMAGIDLLVELLDLTRAQKMNSAQLLEQFRDTDEFSALRKLAQWEHQVADENLEQEFKKSLVWLNNQYIEQRYQELSLKQTHTKEEKIQLKKLIAAMKSCQ